MDQYTRDRAQRVLVDHLGVKPVDVTDEANIIDDLGADSLDTIEIVMALEEEFNIEIPDEEFEAVETFGDVLRVLEIMGA